MKTTQLNAPWKAKEMYTGWQVINAKNEIVACSITVGRRDGECLAKMLANVPQLIVVLEHCRTVLFSQVKEGSTPEIFKAYDEASVLLSKILDPIGI